MLGLASCDTDKDPKLTIPEGLSFVLNEPVFAHQYLQLQEGNTFELVASQPDYGFAAAAVYSVEVSLAENFAEAAELTPLDPGMARMTFNDEDLAKILCKLNGIGADYQGPMPDAQKVYFRAYCEIPGVEGSRCSSNVVSMDQVKTYFATQGKREIYLVGSVSGWQEPAEPNASHYSTWKLTETEIGSNVYYGSFQFPAGDAEFRFYTALTGWDGGASVGSQEADEAIDINGDFTDNVYEGPCVMGKGKWKFSMPTENNVSLTVDLKNMTVKFEIGGDVNWDIYPCMYIVGNVSGWTDPFESNKAAYADYRIFDIEGNGIYVTRPDAPIAYTEAPMFRFYKALTGWDEDSWGSQADDSPLDQTITDGVFEGTAVKGKGSFNFPTAPVPGTMAIEYNSNTNAVKVVFTAQ